MKMTLFFLVFVLSISLVSSRNIDLIIGSNYIIEDKNITLVRLIEDKALICVNGARGVVGKGIPRNVNDVRIDLIKVEGNKARFDFGYSCRGDCVCDISCDNSGCLKSTEIEIEKLDEDGGMIDENGEIIISNEIKEDETIRNEGIGIAGILVAILVILVLGLGVIVLWRRS